MVSQNRILTVSYGTFSCTLEGFDDPFGTMKAIAEYFRDLAAEDRYFGAEPPQPDAAMLHRIAEREIQRRVEAKIQDNGVILRAADLLDRPVPVARPQPVAEPAPEPVAVAPAPALVIETPGPAPRLRAVDDGVAAKLARIRAAVDRSRAAAPVAHDIDDIEDAEVRADPTPQAAALIDDLPESVAEDLSWPDADLAPAVTATVAQTAAPDTEDDIAAVGQDDTVAVVETFEDEDAFADNDPDADHEAAQPAWPADIADVQDPAPVADGLAQAVGTAEPALTPEYSDAAPQAVVEVSLPESAQDAVSMAAALVATPPAPVSPEPDAAAAPRQVSGWHLRRRQRRLNREAAAALAADEAPAAPVAEPPVDVSMLAEPVLSDDFDLDALEATLEGIEAEAAAAVAAPQDAVAQVVVDAPDADAVHAELAALLVVAADSETAEAETLEPEAVEPVAAAPLAPPQPAKDEAPAAPVADDVDMLIARLAKRDPAAPAPAPAAEAETEAEAAPRVRVIKVRRARPQDDAGAALMAEPEAPVADLPAPVAQAPAAPLAEAVAPVQPQDLAPPAVPDVSGLSDLFQDAPEAQPPAAVVAPQPVRPSRPLPARPILSRAPTQRPVAPRPDIAVPNTGAPVSPARPVRHERTPDRSSDRRGALDRGADRGEAAVDRLLRQANTEMSEPDTRRRTSTIAHLKAAVAATVAERLTPRGPNAPTEPDSTAAYRNDLASAVRPRRPGESASDAPAQPDQARVAPLVLVSAQRIDRPAAPAAIPSRPRSMAATALAISEPDDDELMAAEGAPSNLFGGIGAFADWAQDAGMLDLADRLEAAGAWLMAAEGLEGFNRPQLMRIAAADEAAESREAAMAAFGALLRDGRIVKARRGMFTLPPGSAALAKAHKASR